MSLADAENGDAQPVDGDRAGDEAADGGGPGESEDDGVSVDLESPPEPQSPED